MNDSIVIASPDSEQCDGILSMIYRSKLDYTVVGIAPDGYALGRLIENTLPGIVIMDHTILREDVFRLIRQTWEECGFKIRFILMGPKDFDLVYQAMKAGIADYVLTPVTEEALRVSLTEVSSVQERMLNRDAASRRFYITDNSIDVLRKHPLTLKQLNAAYGTHFINGLYQMLFIKFDFPNSFERLNDNNTPIFQHLSEFINGYFQGICSDIIFEAKSDGIMILLNYAQAMQTSISAKITDLYDRIAALIRPYKQMNTTVCVSSVVSDACDVWQIKKQVREAEWSRMHYGINKLIFWTPVSTLIEEQARERLDPIMNDVRQALENLNTAKFKTAMREFYALSLAHLVSGVARDFTRQVVSQMFQLHWDTIANFTDPTVYYDEISYCLHLCATFEQHQQVLLTQCTELLRQIAAQSSKTYSPAVSQAIAFVKNNADKTTLLEDVAAEVNLSKGYFSHLFKVETGMNFTKFVNNYKNRIACEFLKSSNLNISEIACRIGIPDVRAFSKKFRALNNTTPSQYRQVHRAEGRHSL